MSTSGTQRRTVRTESTPINSDSDGKNLRMTNIAKCICDCSLGPFLSVPAGAMVGSTLGCLSSGCACTAIMASAGWWALYMTGLNHILSIGELCFGDCYTLPCSMLIEERREEWNEKCPSCFKKV